MRDVLFWHNFKTGSWDERNTPIETDGEAIQYIPQDVASQRLYQCYRELGLGISAAMINVLHQNVGEAPPFDLPA